MKGRLSNNGQIKSGIIITLALLYGFLAPVHGSRCMRYASCICPDVYRMYCSGNSILTMNDIIEAVPVEHLEIIDGRGRIIGPYFIRDVARSCIRLKTLRLEFSDCRYIIPYLGTVKFVITHTCHLGPTSTPSFENITVTDVITTRKHTTPHSPGTVSTHSALPTTEGPHTDRPSSSPSTTIWKSSTAILPTRVMSSTPEASSFVYPNTTHTPHYPVTTWSPEPSPKPIVHQIIINMYFYILIPISVSISAVCTICCLWRYKKKHGHYPCCCKKRGDPDPENPDGGGGGGGAGTAGAVGGRDGGGPVVLFRPGPGGDGHVVILPDGRNPAPVNPPVVPPGPGGPVNPAPGPVPAPVPNPSGPAARPVPAPVPNPSGPAGLPVPARVPAVPVPASLPGHVGPGFPTGPLASGTRPDSTAFATGLSRVMIHRPAGHGRGNPPPIPPRHGPGTDGGVPPGARMRAPAPMSGLVPGRATAPTPAIFRNPLFHGHDGSPPLILPGPPSRSQSPLAPSLPAHVTSTPISPSQDDDSVLSSHTSAVSRSLFQPSDESDTEIDISGITEMVTISSIDFGEETEETLISETKFNSTVSTDTVFTPEPDFDGYISESASGTVSPDTSHTTASTNREILQVSGESSQQDLEKSDTQHSASQSPIAASPCHQEDNHEARNLQVSGMCSPQAPSASPVHHGNLPHAEPATRMTPDPLPDSADNTSGNSMENKISDPPKGKKKKFSFFGLFNKKPPGVSTSTPSPDRPKSSPGEKSGGESPPPDSGIKQEPISPPASAEPDSPSTYFTPAKSPPGNPSSPSHSTTGDVLNDTVSSTAGLLQPSNKKIKKKKKKEYSNVKSEYTLRSDTPVKPVCGLTECDEPKGVKRKRRK